MHLHKQVCTLEQGIAFKEKGVTAQSHLTWVFDTLNGRWDLSGMPVEAHKLLSREQAYPAYTSAELGVVIGTFFDGGGELPDHLTFPDAPAKSFFDAAFIARNVLGLIDAALLPVEVINSLIDKG